MKLLTAKNNKMCNTKSMKKNLVYLLPLCVLALTACEGFSFGFNNGDEHSAGLDNSLSNSQSQRSSYSYYSGDNFVADDYSATIITFTNIETNESNITDLQKIVDYLSISEESTIIEVSDPNYLGTKEEGLLFIGTSTPGFEGTLTMTFNVQLAAISIETKPYSYVNNAYNQEEVIVDHNVAISVNNSAYILLAEDIAEENGTEIVSTECRYALAEEADGLTIRVANGRAIFESITVYYS